MNKDKIKSVIQTHRRSDSRDERLSHNAKNTFCCGPI